MSQSLEAPIVGMPMTDQQQAEVLRRLVRLGLIQVEEGKEATAGPELGRDTP